MIANERKINYFLAAINISIAMNLLTVNLLRKLLANNEEDFFGWSEGIEVYAIPVVTLNFDLEQAWNGSEVIVGLRFWASA